MPGMFVGISMPYLHFSASNSRSKHPVPAGASWPSIMFSDTPFMGSHSPWDDASISTSTWRTNCKDQREKPFGTIWEVFPVSLLSHRLLKGALHERSRVLTIDAVSCDGHQVAAARHSVAKQRQVAVVDVGAVKGDDVVQLPLQGLSHRLNSQHLMVHDQHLNISCRPIKVNCFFCFFPPPSLP